MNSVKIYCEKCHEEITGQVNKNIENYTVGNIVCSKCQHHQKRYISEADLLLYFGINEALYMVFTFLSVFILKKFGLRIAECAIVLILLILFCFLAKNISSNIYAKAYFKEDLKDRVFEEDAKAIQKNLSWQFVLFFVIAISYVTIDEGNIFFAFAMPIAVILTFIKFYLQLKNERNA